jgi:hypothetical protein
MSDIKKDNIDDCSVEELNQAKVNVIEFITNVRITLLKSECDVKKCSSYAELKEQVELLENGLIDFLI